MAKAKTEIASITGGAPLRPEQLTQLSYCQQVIKETMRIISPVWVLGREALGDDMLGSYPVKKGQSVIFSPYLVHRHPDFWDNPEAFVPERFSPQNESTRHKFAYFPFGGGPRLCIGSSFALMEMQLILATLLQQFDFSLVETAPPGYSFSLTLRPATEIWLNVQRSH